MTIPNPVFLLQGSAEEGRLFGVDLGVPREIRTVSIVMGRNDSDKDAVNKDNWKYPWTDSHGRP